MRQTPIREPFYVSFIGHRWGNAPVSFKTAELAIESARRMCHEAMVTEVYDCTDSNNGVLILALSRSGADITDSRK